MAKEYKFMFDRRFDEPEEELPAVKEDLSAKSVDGIPSISELLDTLNEQIRNDAGQEQAEETPPEPAQAESAVPADQPEPPPAEETNATAAAQPSPEEELQAAVQSVQTALEQNVEPVFTQNEMDAAKNQAREEGRLQGLEEGRENAWQEAMVSIEKQNSDTLNAIDASLKELLARSQNDSQTAFTTAVGFAMAVCRKVVPALSEKTPSAKFRDCWKKTFIF